MTWWPQHQHSKGNRDLGREARSGSSGKVTPKAPSLTPAFDKHPRTTNDSAPRFVVKKNESTNMISVLLWICCSQPQLDSDEELSIPGTLAGTTPLPTRVVGAVALGKRAWKRLRLGLASPRFACQNASPASRRHHASWIDLGAFCQPASDAPVQRPTGQPPPSGQVCLS